MSSLLADFSLHPISASLMLFTAGWLKHIGVCSSDLTSGNRWSVCDGWRRSELRSISSAYIHFSRCCSRQIQQEPRVSRRQSQINAAALQRSSGFRCNRDAPHKRPTIHCGVSIQSGAPLISEVLVSSWNASRTQIIHARQQYKRPASLCVSVIKVINKAVVYWAVLASHHRPNHQFYGYIFNFGAFTSLSLQSLFSGWASIRTLSFTLSFFLLTLYCLMHTLIFRSCTLWSLNIIFIRVLIPPMKLM